MNAKEAVLTQYRTGSEDQRLSLFVFHRELRPAFSQIDLENDGAWGQEEVIAPKLPRLVGLLAAGVNTLRAMIS